MSLNLPWIENVRVRRTYTGLRSILLDRVTLQPGLSQYLCSSTPLALLPNLHNAKLRYIVESALHRSQETPLKDAQMHCPTLWCWMLAL